MEFISKTLIDIFSLVLDMAKIIIPLMIVIEILKDLKLIERLAKIAKPITSFFTMSEKSAVSMIVGIFIGLLYGAGVIIQSVEEENLDERSVFLLCIFLSLCHAIVEDTILFKATGANLLPILICRLIAATIITFVVARIVKNDNDNINSNELKNLTEHNH